MDASVVAAAQSGDRLALDDVCRGLYAPMYHAAFGVLANHADTEDAVQQALINVVRNVASFDGRSAITTWAHRIALNAALDLRRRQATRPTAPIELHPNDVASADSSEALAARELVLSALRQLPDDHAEVIVLRELLGYDYSDIATALDVPVGTVRSRLSRARQGLETALKELLNDDLSPRYGTLPSPSASNQR
jgi:RNA polymerase sigma-70 factor (ECF subfamily)